MMRRVRGRDDQSRLPFIVGARGQRPGAEGTVAGAFLHTRVPPDSMAENHHRRCFPAMV